MHSTCWPKATCCPYSRTPRQTVEISGQPIIVTPLAGTGSGVCSITVVFLLTAPPNTGVELPDGTWVEAPPQQDGPLTAAAIAASTQGSVDLLASGTINLAAGTPNYTPDLTAVHSYSTVMVVIGTGATQTVAITANVQRITPVLTQFPPQTQTIPPLSESTSFALSAVFLLAALAIGDVFQVALESPVTANGLAYQVYGLTELATQQVMAPGGNPLSTAPRGGVLKVTISVPAGTTNILPAPPTGYVYRVHVLGAISNATVWSDLGTPGGTIAITADAHSPSMQVMDGQVVTGALQVNNTGAAEQAFVTYDTIPAQSIQ